MKKFIALASVLVLLAAGIAAVQFDVHNVPISYDGSNTDVVELYHNPSDYDTKNPDGIASIIVETNLYKTMAANNVAAIVFDYRGFDTIGESFILLAAIAGSYAILRKPKKEKKEESDEA